MKKKLVINSEKDLKKFYRRLFWYRTFLYHFVQFELEEDKYKIDELIEALNIKNRRARLEFIHDTACDEVDNHFKGKNICGFKNGQCYMQRKLNSDKVNGCCRRCIYQTLKGCPTKNLSCKLFFCTEVKKRHKIITIDDIKIVRVLTFRQRAIIKSDYFCSRDDVINDLYLNSYIIGVMRICYRLIRNFIRNSIRKMMKNEKVN